MNLLVFDFDCSLINDNSDTFVIERLHPELYPYIIKKAVHNEEDDSIYKVADIPEQWTDRMDFALGEIYKKGVCREQLESCLKEMQLDLEMKETLNAAHLDETTTLAIISDANTVYIDVILRGSGIDPNIFKYVVTNPSVYDQNGKLQVKRYLQETEKPHACKLCNVNMCKGAVLDSFGKQNYETIIYVGDSRNDFCPCSRLDSHDLILARRGFPLEKLLLKATASSASTPSVFDLPINAKITAWDNYKDIKLAVKEHFNI